jgi:hypothetical protein
MPSSRVQAERQSIGSTAARRQPVLRADSPGWVLHSLSPRVNQIGASNPCQQRIGDVQNGIAAA